MKYSQFYVPTLKETPHEAELISHQLMLRSGMIRKLAAGLYSWLPLGLRVLRKVETIIREEMDAAGGIELLMPAIQPAELWQETGRWEDYGHLLLRMQDRQQRAFCFGPTHEEVITDLLRKELRSYKQLPRLFYQIQNKFRDEIRPRFGVMRAREFLMKDAYSFNLDSASLQASYEQMYQTYCRIFNRLGLQFRAVNADSGEIGGAVSHEFHVLADSGEDTLFYSDASDYAANIEQAVSLPPQGSRAAPGASKEKIATIGTKTITQICEHLGVPKSQTLKTLIVHGAEQPLVGLLLRGDHDLNPTKAAKHPLIKSPLTLASDVEIKHACQCDPGFVGPLGLSLPLLADHSVSLMSDFVCGANENDYHWQHVNWERDLPLPATADLRNVVPGDPSPDGKGHLQTCRGIEVGHIFQLGRKYSQAMGLKVLNEQGKAVTVEMGCYGIGVSRIVASAIEQNHDSNGIIWPDPIAPFQFALIPLNTHKSQRLTEASLKLYQDLLALGFEVLLDDRHERPGVKFADMDLLGIPHKLIFSDKGIDNQQIEYQHRRTHSSQFIALSQLNQFLEECIQR